METIEKTEDEVFIPIAGTVSRCPPRVPTISTQDDEQESTEAKILTLEEIA